MELELTVDQVKDKLGKLTATTPGPREGDLIQVVYQPFKNLGMEQDGVQTYTGILEIVKTATNGELVFILSSVQERGGEFRSFNPAKGRIFSIKKVYKRP